MMHRQMQSLTKTKKRPAPTNGTKACAPWYHPNCQEHSLLSSLAALIPFNAQCTPQFIIEVLWDGFCLNLTESSQHMLSSLWADYGS